MNPCFPCATSGAWKPIKVKLTVRYCPHLSAHPPSLSFSLSLSLRSHCRLQAHVCARLEILLNARSEGGSVRSADKFHLSFLNNGALPEGWNRTSAKEVRWPSPSLSNDVRIYPHLARNTGIRGYILKCSDIEGR